MIYFSLHENLEDEVIIPKHHSQNSPRALGADEFETAGGMIRRDILTIRRSWDIESNYISNTITKNFLDYMDSVFWKPILINFDSLGTEWVKCLVALEDDERVSFSRNGMWESDGSNLRLTLRERGGSL